MGKKLTVALYSGHMLAMVVRSGADSWETPGPKNSTNFPAIPACLKCYKINPRKTLEYKSVYCMSTPYYFSISVLGFHFLCKTSSQNDIWRQSSATFVMPRTMSIDVVSGLMVPTSLQPTTWGSVRETGWPNITASDSIPPTPGGGAQHGRKEWKHYF